MKITTLARKDFLRTGGASIWFFFAVSLAVGALFTLKSWELAFDDAISSESRKLLGADISLTSRNPEVLAAQYSPSESSEMISLTTMLSATEGARLSLLRGIEPVFPLLGDLTTEPEGARDSLGSGSVLVDRNLSIQLGLSVGSKVSILGNPFEVVGIVTSVPGDLPFRTFVAPRAYISLSELKDLGLQQRGARVFYSRQFTVSPSDFESATAYFRELSRTGNFELETRVDREARFRRGANAAVKFFSIFSIVSLVLAGLSIVSGVHVLVNKKIRASAILRAIGFTPYQVIAIFSLQTLVLSFAASVLGVLIGYFSLSFLWSGLDDYLGVSIGSPSLNGAYTAVLFGTFGSFLLSLSKLARLRRVSPSALFSDQPKYTEFGNRDLLGLLFIVLAVSCLLLFFGTNTDNFRTLSITFFGVVLLLVVLRVVAFLLSRGALLFSKLLNGLCALGVRALGREGNNTSFLLTVIGVSICIAVFSSSLRLSLVQVINPDSDVNGLILDVQSYQLDGVLGLLEQQGVENTGAVGISTMRLSAFKGLSVVDVLAAGSQEYPRWLLSREFRAGERSHLLENEELLDGTIQEEWSEGMDIKVSVAERMASQMQIGVGDELEFNVFGEVIQASVGSIRKIDWTSINPNLFVVFPEDSLAAYPKNFLIPVFTKDAFQSGLLQKALISEFGNVSLLDARDLIDSVELGLGRLSNFISFFSGVVLLLCLVVLAASLSSSGEQRALEARLFKTLGATPAQVRLLLVIEYSVLGLLGVASGLMLGLAGAWAASSYILKSPLAVDQALIVYCLLVGIFSSILTGFLTERRALL